MRMARISSWMRGVMRREKVEREMQEEMRFHVDAYAEDLMRRGVARELALRQARMEFGCQETHKEDCRASFGLRAWDELRGDLRYSFRILRRNPGFAAAAVATLALAIGANTAIFTLVDAVLLKLVPVQRPEELYQVKLVNPARPDRPDGSFTNPLWESLRDVQDVFSGMATWGNTDFNLARGGEVRQAHGLWVNGDYFATLGVRPAAGRLIAVGDDRRGCAGTAVLSYGFWQDHYAGAADAVGSTLTLDGKPFEVIGVAMPGFYGLDVGMKFDVAAPICATQLFDGKESRLDIRDEWWLTAVGRKKNGESVQQLTTRLKALSPQVMTATLPPRWRADAKKDYVARSFIAVPAANGVSWPWSLRDRFREPLTVLMGVVGIVLLIACANVAGLMLARGAAQRREIGVRLALGAGRARLVRQSLTHALTLATLGAACGLVLSEWGTKILVTALSTHSHPVFLDLTPDWRIAAFTAVVAMLTACLFGALPALRSTRVEMTESMRSSPASQTERHGAVRKGMVVAQIALSLVLLVAAGLFLRTFDKLLTLDPGFDRDQVLLARTDLTTSRIPREQQAAVMQRIEERLSSLPGVQAVGHAHIMPLSGGAWNSGVQSDVPNMPQDGEAESLMNFISPGYLPAMRIALLAGRDFTLAETKTSAPVAIVNLAFARKFFGAMDPIGRTIRVDDVSGKPGTPIQVVGLVADAKYRSMREDMKPTVFFPLTQIPEPIRAVTFAIRTSTEPGTMTKTIEAAVAEIDPQIPLEFTTLAGQVNDAMVQERLLAILSAFFGAVAVVLAMIGLFGTVSYHVTLRRAEFGIRMALGARVRAIVSMVIREAAVIVAAGLIAGLAIAALATKAIGKLLFGVGAHDVATLSGASALLAIVALGAAYVPARRAAKVDPMIALRCE